MDGKEGAWKMRTAALPSYAKPCWRWECVGERRNSHQHCPTPPHHHPRFCFIPNLESLASSSEPCLDWECFDRISKLGRKFHPALLFSICQYDVLQMCSNASSTTPTLLIPPKMTSQGLWEMKPKGGKERLWRLEEYQGSRLRLRSSPGLRFPGWKSVRERKKKNPQELIFRTVKQKEELLSIQSLFRKREDALETRKCLN